MTHEEGELESLDNIEQEAEQADAPEIVQQAEHEKQEIETEERQEHEEPPFKTVQAKPSIRERIGKTLNPDPDQRALKQERQQAKHDKTIADLRRKVAQSEEKVLRQKLKANKGGGRANVGSFRGFAPRGFDSAPQRPQEQMVPVRAHKRRRSKNPKMRSKQAILKEIRRLQKREKSLLAQLERM